MAAFGLITLVAGSGIGRLDQLTSSLRDLGDGPVSDDPTPVLFRVRPGSSATAIASELERAGLIRSAQAFRLQVEIRGVGRRLGVGEYQLRRNMTVREILDTLSGGQALGTGLVTIPEGWRAEEVALLLEARGVTSAAAFMEVVSGQRGAGPQLPAAAPTLEGYLFPDSYDFGREPTPEGVVRTLLTQFERRVDAEVRASAAARGLSVHELIVLASIVEREAMESHERGDIAAVYHNRLARGMPLQADPTVQYALVPFGVLSAGLSYWPEVVPEDLAVDSPFNTYRVNGLVPGPICNPGMASIRAAAQPEDRPWLYFVARGDGSHLFAETLQEHLRNVALVNGRG